jgi:predicted helicase
LIRCDSPRKERKDTIIYNSRITIENIPAKAYEYVVNGKSAIEWIMERYQVTVDKKSGIKNDPNDWAQEVGKLELYIGFASQHHKC